MKRRIGGPAFVVGDRKIESVPSDDENFMGFRFSEKVLFVPPGYFAEVEEDPHAPINVAPISGSVKHLYIGMPLDG